MNEKMNKVAGTAFEQMPKRRGRPKLPQGQARSILFTMRVREDELEALRERARGAGVALSDFVRQVLLSGPTTGRCAASGPTTGGRTT